tara:strand:- start:630 stop:1286 length:657 start_codon:yes stop_codon:yes gene_type:complete
MIITTILPIFFLYFILLSGYCAELLNCRLQKEMDSMIYFRHFLIFLSIYIFTFVLNWYTFDSLQIKHIGESNEEKYISKYVTKNFNFSLLGEWFIKSVLIYCIFLITTKTELIYIYIFFVFILLSLIIQIILKSITTIKYKHANDLLFITEKNYNDINKEKVILLHNINSGGFITVMSLVFYGFINYYNRQRKDHKKNWDFFKFLFGTSIKGKECQNY